MSTANAVNRLDQLNKKLDVRASRTNLGSTLTLLIGLLAIGLLSFYFYYGYTKFQEVSNPQQLFKIAQDEFITHLGEVRQSAETEIRKSAPQWAEDASNQLLTQMPVLRGELDKQIRTFLDTYFKDATAVTEQKFREMLSTHREDIKKAVDTILSDKDSQAFMSEFMPVVEQTIGVDIQNNASEALGGFVDLNDRLERLAKGENLSDLEKQQRYVLGLVQRLRIEQTELN